VPFAPSAHDEDPVISCYYSDETANYIFVDSPWTPHPLSGQFGETEWFTDRIFQWDPGTQTWNPVSTPSGGWQDWAYTYPANQDELFLTWGWGGPWFAQGGGYLNRQTWTVPAGTYFRIAAWIQWQDAAGNVETFRDANGNVQDHLYEWAQHVFTSDGTGPWCRY
jgi:hypothetical protein